jgi:hypothetical protein
MEAAVAALLALPTVAAAAQKAGVSERTLRNWLKLPAFVSAYREARRQIVELAIGQLQRLTHQAVEALQKNLACGKEAVEVSAAFGVLDRAFKGVELVDLAERVKALERQDQERKERGNNR